METKEDAAVTAWTDAKLIDEPLFCVPWEGDRQLIPVRTPRALRDAAALFASNMWDRLDWFLDGQEACFLWAGTEKAATMLRTDAFDGWTVREITGRDGGAVSDELQREIVARLAAAGFRARAALARAGGA